VGAIRAIRAPASENAAAWMHLLAGTVAAVVIVPRLVLAGVAGLVERRRAAHVVLPLSEPYYQRLVSGYLGGPGRIRILPYSYTVSLEARAGLEAILARAYGGAAANIEAPVAWGDDEALAALSGAAAQSAPGAGQEAIVPLFSLAATPEREAHGAFLDALIARAGTGHPLIALVDESGFLARWPDDEQRRTERRAAWRDLITGYGASPVFVDLVSPDLAAAESELAAAASARDSDEPPHRRVT